MDIDTVEKHKKLDYINDKGFIITRNAITSQLGAMGCDKYEIGILDRKNGTMTNHPKLSEQDITSPEFIQKLRRENAHGMDIFIRPDRASQTNLVLIDDITRFTVDFMKKRDLDGNPLNGWEPCAVVETSPANYQAWIKLHQPVSPEAQRAVARMGVKMFDGDPGSASKEHYGRLAGFTNRKPCHRQEDGMYPFAKVTEATGIIASGSQRIVPAAENQAVKDMEADAQRQALRAQQASQQPGSMSEQRIDKWWQATMATIQQKNGQSVGQSELDFSMSKMLAEKGCAVDQISDAIQRNSPDLESRRKGHVVDYADRTAQKAHASAMIQAKEEHASEQVAQEPPVEKQASKGFEAEL